MGYLLAVGITVGLLAGAWVYLSGVAGMIGFAGFLGWASYFAAGGGGKGVKSAFCSNLSGVFWGVATVFLCGILPGVPGLVFTVLFAAIMCWQARFSFVGFFIQEPCPEARVLDLYLLDSVVLSVKSVQDPPIFILPNSRSST